MALYLLDWDGIGRSERIDVLDGTTGKVLDSRTVGGFSGGEYLVWTLKGHVRINLTNLGGPDTHDAVVSGIFFGYTPNPAPAAATFLADDTTTQGGWIGTYGSQGYNVIDDSASYPAYAQVFPSNQLDFVWATSVPDGRVLQRASNPADNIAATWYAATSFTVDVNLTDGLTHDLALYLLDWGTTTRVEQVTITSAATGTVLDTETVSSFHSGVYLQWMVRGNVVITITKTGGNNAVLSGLFLDPAVG